MQKYVFFLTLFILFLTPQFDNTTEAAVPQQNYNNKLTEYLRTNSKLKGSISAVSIRSASTGQLLYSYNGETRLTPASNMKLFTAAAALELLGPQYRFDTEIWTDGAVKWNGLVGNLYLKGKGDPTLLSKDFDQLAKRLKSKGIHYVSGDLVGDDTWYDDVRYSIDLPWSDEAEYYGAQISALTAAPDEDYDAGTIRIDITPAKKENEPPIIRVFPKLDLFKVHNFATTVSDPEKSSLKISREHGTNELIVEGEIPIETETFKEWVSVWDTSNYALSLFEKSLKDNGIKLIGKTGIGSVPIKSELLTKHSSIKLSELMVPFMKLSNNTHAEVLIKEMGKVKGNEGSWSAGIQADIEVLEKLGVPVQKMVIRDASGVSHMNLVEADIITKLLYNIQDAKWFGDFYHSLPVSGVNDKLVGGTLAKRFTKGDLKGNIIAKTGSLTNVSSLSGYTKDKYGNNIIFSILLNHLREDQNGKQIEVDILKLITDDEL